MEKYYDDQVYRNLTNLLQKCVDYKVKHPRDYSFILSLDEDNDALSVIDGHIAMSDFYIGTEMETCSNSTKIVMWFDVENPAQAIECLAEDGGELLSNYGLHTIVGECYDAEQAANLFLAVFKKVWGVTEIPELEVSSLTIEEVNRDFKIELQVANSDILYSKIAAMVQEFNALATANGYETLSFSEQTGMLTGSWDANRKPKGLFAKGRSTYKKLHKQLIAITDLAVQ